VYNFVFVTVADSFQDLLNAVAGVYFTVELSRHNIFEQFTASDSAK
jgi:hypothetical protein